MECRCTAGIARRQRKSQADTCVSTFQEIHFIEGIESTTLRDFTSVGIDVLLFDHRGYGDNEGSPEEASLRSDAESIWQFAHEDLNRSQDRTIVFGESLGGAIAISLCSSLAEHGESPAALVTSSTFHQLSEVVARKYPAFPFRYLLLDRWPSGDRIGNVTCPILILHGQRDDFVSIEQGRKLHRAAGVNARFVEVPRAGHNDISSILLREELRRLLNRIRVEEGESS